MRARSEIEARIGPLFLDVANEEGIVYSLIVIESSAATANVVAADRESLWRLEHVRFSDGTVVANSGMDEAECLRVMPGRAALLL